MKFVIPCGWQRCAFTLGQAEQADRVSAFAFVSLSVSLVSRLNAHPFSRRGEPFQKWKQTVSKRSLANSQQQHQHNNTKQKVQYLAHVRNNKSKGVRLFFNNVCQHNKEEAARRVQYSKSGFDFEKGERDGRVELGGMMHACDTGLLPSWLRAIHQAMDGKGRWRWGTMIQVGPK